MSRAMTKYPAPGKLPHGFGDDAFNTEGPPPTGMGGAENYILPQMGNHYMNYSEGNYDDDKYNQFARFEQSNTRANQQFAPAQKPIQPPIQPPVFQPPNVQTPISPPHNLQEFKIDKQLPYNVCPICFTKAISICNCQFRDAKCKLNHQWYQDKGERVIGISPTHK